MGEGFLAEIEPPALRQRTLEAVYRVFAVVIATNPQLAPAAYLSRGRISLADGNEDAAVQDFRAAVASQDAAAVYRATGHLLQMSKSLAPLEWADTPQERAYEIARDRAGLGLHGGRKSRYTAEISALARASFDMRQFLEELRAILAPSVVEVAS